MLNFNMPNPLLYEEIGQPSPDNSGSGLSLPSRIIMNTQPSQRTFILCVWPAVQDSHVSF